MRKHRRAGQPRTVTGRVAVKLVDAVDADRRRVFGTDAAGASFEGIYMLVAAQVSQQGLDPSDFDNGRGQDALEAIYATVVDRDRELIRVTPAWRRVVISARHRKATQPISMANRMVWVSRSPAVRAEKRDHIGMRRVS